MENRPHAREKGEASGSGNVFRRGSGLGTDRVGTGGSGGGFDPGDRGSGKRSSGTGGGLPGGLAVLVVVIFLIFRGCGSLFGGLTGGSGTTAQEESAGTGAAVQQTAANTAGTSAGNTASGTGSGYGTGTAQHTYVNADSETLNTSVSDKARARFTKLKGNNQDTVTVMVYMCGADLESKSGAATADLQEMASAGLDNPNVTVIAETGGAKKWQNSVISSRTLQRWKVVKGGLEPLDKNVGAARMTDPDTLTGFIDYTKNNFPADRYMLILWDHGGGSVTGYGYDELYPTEGSISIDKIASALKKGGLQYDFLGFDACLMATMETSLAVEPYADYLIASEESEPGSGWYYTNWLNLLSENSSTPTTALGKQIIDDFTEVTAQSYPGYSGVTTTLSLIDLAEAKGTIPAALTSFGTGLSKTIKSDNYQHVADARYETREFAAAEHIDQVDLVNFCDNLETAESRTLAEAVRGCVKYNRTSNITNAYGMSIYFPYASLRAMNSMVKIYNNLNIDPAYTESVKSFATLESSGQISASSSGNGTGSLIDVLLGGSSSGSGSSSAGMQSSDLIALLEQALSSAGSSSSSASDHAQGVTNGYGAGYPAGNTADYSSVLGGDSSWVDSGSLEAFSQYLNRNHVDSGKLTLTENKGKQVLALSEDQWKLIQSCELNVFADDGKGYIDMGLDNTFQFDDDGNLIIDYDGTWLALDGHPAAYYMTSDEAGSDGSYTTKGYIPALLNGTRVNILVQFTDQKPEGEILGAQNVYQNNVLGKGISQIKRDDKIDFLCDYYSYDGTFNDSYYLGDPLTVSTDTPALSMIRLNDAGSNFRYGFRLTDIYNAHYWTPMSTRSGS